MHYAKISTRCSIRNGWFGSVRLSSAGSTESDLPLDEEISMEEPLARTNWKLYEYYREVRK